MELAYLPESIVYFTALATEVQQSAVLCSIARAFAADKQIIRAVLQSIVIAVTHITM